MSENNIGQDNQKKDDDCIYNELNNDENNQLLHQQTVDQQEVQTDAFNVRDQSQQCEAASKIHQQTQDSQYNREIEQTKELEITKNQNINENQIQEDKEIQQLEQQQDDQANYMEEEIKINDNNQLEYQKDQVENVSEDDSIQEIKILNDALGSYNQDSQNQEEIYQKNQNKGISDDNEQEPLHVLQESKSLIDLKINTSNNNEKKGKGKLGKKSQKQVKAKRILSPEELNDFLKKHKLISSSSLSESIDEQVQIKSKVENKQKVLTKEHKAVKKEQPYKLLQEKRVQPKQYIYRMCRDPNVKRYNDQKPLQRRKFFSLLDLDLFKYNIQNICSFLTDKDILKLRLVNRALQPYLRQYFTVQKKETIEKIIFQKKIESFDLRDRIYKNAFFQEKIETLVGHINQNISHVHLFLYFDKLKIETLKVNEVKLIKVFYEVLKTKPCIINSMQVLNYCANRKDDKTLFGDLNLSYDFMNEKLQEKFYQELQVIIDFIKINNSAIFPFILENQIFILKKDIIQKIERNIFIEKTYSSKILKGLYQWLELQLFYNQYFDKEPAFNELLKNQESINYIKHSFDINQYLINKQL